MTPRAWLALALPLGLALAGPASAAPAPARLSPDWTDPEARTEAQLRVVEGLVEAGLAEDALKNIARLRQEGVDDPRFEVLKARALESRGLSGEATQILEGYVQKHRRDPEAWALLGVLYADAERVRDSVAALGKASRLDPNDPAVLNNLGWVQLAAGQAKDAVESFRASLSLDAAQPRTRNNLGFALARLERDDEALQMFRTTGSEADARYNLGLACELRSDRTSAITHYQAALQARPDHPGAGPALSRLLTERSP